MSTPLPNIKCVVAELIGTYILVVLGAGAAIVSGDVLHIAFAHGFAVTACIYAFYQFSGAHINPAVSLAVFLAGGLSFRKMLWYIMGQCLGGCLAAVSLFWLLFPSSVMPSLSRLSVNTNALQGVLIEALLTFILVMIILHTMLIKQRSRFGGLAIGAVLIACILMGIHATGASLNPARSIGPALVTGQFTSLWVYILGPCLGASLASLLYRYCFSLPLSELCGPHSK